MQRKIREEANEIKKDALSHLSEFKYTRTTQHLLQLLKSSCRVTLHHILRLDCVCGKEIRLTSTSDYSLQCSYDLWLNFGVQLYFALLFAPLL
jgi:hypothetical protein